jgi:hypothetical protein
MHVLYGPSATRSCVNAKNKTSTILHCVILSIRAKGEANAVYVQQCKRAIVNITSICHAALTHSTYFNNASVHNTDVPNINMQKIMLSIETQYTHTTKTHLSVQRCGAVLDGSDS